MVFYPFVFHWNLKRCYSESAQYFNSHSVMSNGRIFSYWGNLHLKFIVVAKRKGKRYFLSKWVGISISSGIIAPTKQTLQQKFDPFDIDLLRWAKKSIFTDTRLLLAQGDHFKEKGRSFSRIKILVIFLKKSGYVLF